MKNQNINIRLYDTDIVENLDKLGSDIGVTAKDLSEIGKTFGEEYKASIWNMGKYLEGTNEMLSKIQDAYNEYYEQFKQDAQKAAENNVYKDAWEKAQQKKSEPQTNPDVYDDMGSYGRREEMDKIGKDDTLSDGEKYGRQDTIDKIYQSKKQEDRKEQLVKMGMEMEEIVADSLQDIILDFDNFDKSIKNMSNKLMSYLVKQFTDMMFDTLNEKVTQSEWFGKIMGKSSQGGVIGGVASIFTGFFGGKHHSGGLIPNAGYSLGGTSEQLAILKGGERVLSPGENVEYNRENDGGSKVNFINFNVKAWDSKDVQKFLIENKNLLNQITFQGIKDNNQMLRYIVRSA